MIFDLLFLSERDETLTGNSREMQQYKSVEINFHNTRVTLFCRISGFYI